MKHIAVIYDRDPLYAVKLAGYLNTFEGFPFDTRAFSTENGVETFCVNETVDIAMIDENSLYMVDRLVFKELVVLSTDCSRQNNGTLYVYKYQNGAKILKELMRYLAESDKIGSLITRKNEMRIISFFSPVKRVMATTMAIGMGQILGKTKKTLYLNLECFSGLEQILGKPFANDIGDLMYHIESRGTNIGATIAGIAENFDGLDVIPSVKNHNDLLSIASEIWKNLLLHIEQDTDYEYVIIDFSENIRGLFDLLQLSDTIITCMDDDKISTCKLRQYEDELTRGGYESVLSKTKKCSIPRISGKTIELRNILLGEMGDYLRTVTNEVLNGA